MTMRRTRTASEAVSSTSGHILRVVLQEAWYD